MGVPVSSNGKSTAFLLRHVDFFLTKNCAMTVIMMLPLYSREQLRSEDIAHDVNGNDLSVIKILNVTPRLCSLCFI